MSYPQNSSQTVCLDDSVSIKSYTCEIQLKLKLLINSWKLILSFFIKTKTIPKVHWRKENLANNSLAKKRIKNQADKYVHKTVQKLINIWYGFCSWLKVVSCHLVSAWFRVVLLTIISRLTIYINSSKSTGENHCTHYQIHKQSVHLYTTTITN